MSELSQLVERLARHGQEHLLRWWDELAPTDRDRLRSEIASIDFGQLDGLIRDLVFADASALVEPEKVAPMEVSRLPRTDGERAARRAATELGLKAIRAGEVAVVLVAGGQGTRLGFDGPKGTYPIGAVSGATLFQIHAEKIRALGERHGVDIPLYVMTSPDNHEATGRFFAENDNFGLKSLRTFVQGQMPAVDAAGGKVLLAEPGRIALSPDGHGGTLRALNAPGPDGGPGCLEEMKQRGIRTIFYFQVDNPFIQVADPAFIGLHRQNEAEMSFKVVEKRKPGEKLGVVVLYDGRPQVIEYSDLSTDLAERRAPDGGLELWAGSIAVHVLEVDFIERIVSGTDPLPFHRAKKKVGFVDEHGKKVEPAEPNAIKFETFIFDALPLAKRFAIVETGRAQEFEPLKNATGDESPASVRRRMSELFADWLEAAGAKVERSPDGSVPFDIEISPLFALDAHDLKGKIPPDLSVQGPLYLR